MYIPRIAEQNIQVSLSNKKVLLLLGARQVGKTTLAKQILPQQDVGFINLDSQIEKEKVITASALSPTEAIKSLGGHKILVIDEAQRLPEISQTVKGWYDLEAPVKVILSGSSSLNILNQSAESLTGRNEKVFLPPLVFSEILAVQEWYSESYSKNILVKNFAKQLEALLLDNLVFGSFPEIVTSTDKTKLLTNLVSDYLLKDVFQLGLVKSPETIRRLLMLLAYQVGSIVSINELSKSLGIARPTVERYIDLLKETFIIFSLPAWSANPRKEISKSQKIYFWDTGVRNALIGEFSTNPMRADIGQLWEAWVVAEFAKQNLLNGQKKQLYFWRSKTGSEVDLIIKENEKINAYEIKWQKKSFKKTAFDDRYKTQVELIDHSDPLFTL